MKRNSMNARQYATALALALKGKTSAEQDTVTTQFIEKIKTRKHLGLLPGILTHLQRGTSTNEEETLVVGRKKDVERARKEAGTEVGAIINPNLIGGWQHHKEGVLTDTSYKRSLIELYRNITK